MNVQLVKFYHIDWRTDYEIPLGFSVEPPLGIAALKAYIQSDKINCGTKVFYLSNEISELVTETVQENSKQNIKNLLENFSKNEALQNSIIYYAKNILKDRPDVIGFSLYEDDYLMSILVSSFIKSVNPQINIVCGGPQWGDFDQARNIIQEYEFIDGIFVGEGEISFKQYLDNLVKAKMTKIPGAILRFSGNIEEDRNQQQVDLEDLPFPDFTDFQKEFFSDKKSTAAISLTRGCIARCKFCSEVNYWKTFRKPSPQYVVNLLTHMKEEYNVKKFNFVDSLINGDLNWLKELLNLIIESKLEIEWYSMSRVDPRMDEDFIKLLKMSGCKELYLGVESYSQTVLENMRKGVVSKNIEPFIKRLSDGGINVQPMYMFGYPEETVQEAKKTISHIRRIVDYCSGILVQRFYLQRNSSLQKSINNPAIGKNSIDDAVYLDNSYLKKNEDKFISVFGDTGYYNFNKFPESKNEFISLLEKFEESLNE